MAEDKAQALKEAGYSIKLIIGESPTRRGGVVDITDAVVSQLPTEVIVPQAGSLDDQGITFSIIGVQESSNGINMLRTQRSYMFLEQDIKPIIEASIVNATQKDAILRLIDQAIDSHVNDCIKGAEHIVEKYGSPIV